MEAGILAAIVILSAELVIICVVIGILFCRRQNKSASMPNDQPSATNQQNQVKTIAIDIVKDDDPILKKEDDTMGNTKSVKYYPNGKIKDDLPPTNDDSDVTNKSFEIKNDETEKKPLVDEDLSKKVVEEKPDDVIEIKQENDITAEKIDDVLPVKSDDITEDNKEDTKSGEIVITADVIASSSSSSSDSSSDDSEQEHESQNDSNQGGQGFEDKSKIQEDESDKDSGHNTLPNSVENGSPLEDRTSSVDKGITLSLIINQLDPNDRDSSSGSSSDETDSGSSSYEEDEDEIVPEDEGGITVTRWIEEAPPPSYNTAQAATTVIDATPHRENPQPTKPNDENAIVAGIINVTTGEKLTICQAVRKGLIPLNTAKLLLEAQAATGGIIVPRTGAKLSVQEAIHRGVVEAKYESTLSASEGAYYGYLDSDKGQNVSLNEAMQRGIFQKAKGMRLLAAQLATGGIIDPWTARRYSLSDALERRLIDVTAAKVLRKPEKSAEFYDPNTGQALNYFHLQKSCIRDLDTGFKFLYVEEKSKAPNYHYQADLMIFQTSLRKKVTAQQLMDAGLLNPKAMEIFSKSSLSRSELQEKLKPILVGTDPICGVLGTSSKQIMSVCEALSSGLIRRSTALGLLEAQVATGSLIDPKTMKKYSVKSSCKHGLVHRKFEDLLLRAESAVYGIRQKGSSQLIPIQRAMKMGMIAEIEGIKLLEAQMSTGGVIDPDTGCRLPESIARGKNLLDDQLINILVHPSNDKKGYYDHATGKNITYKDLLKMSVLVQKKNMTMRLLPIEDGIQITTSHTTVGEERRHRSRGGSSTGSRR